MKRKTTQPMLLNPLSTYILHHGLRLTLLMLFISWLYSRLSGHETVLNTVLCSCRRIYPLLTLMVLAVSVSGALLIDVYDRTQNK